MHTNLQVQAPGKKKKKRDHLMDEETTVSQGQDSTIKIFIRRDVSKSYTV